MQSNTLKKSVKKVPSSSPFFDSLNFSNTTIMQCWARATLTALMKAELRRVLTVTLETNTSFTPNRTHSLAISITLSAIRSSSASALRTQFVPICRAAISVLTKRYACIIIVFRAIAVCRHTAFGTFIYLVVYIPIFHTVR